MTKPIPKVLIIDDDQTILKVLAKVLLKKGYNVDTAVTAQEALEKIKAQSYDAALIDVRLQDVSGLDLLNDIQRLAPNMVKIMLTGYPSEEDRTTALARGADDYLAKPVKSEKLIEVIESKLAQDSCEPDFQGSTRCPPGFFTGIG